MFISWSTRSLPKIYSGFFLEPRGSSSGPTTKPLGISTLHTPTALNSRLVLKLPYAVHALMELQNIYFLVCIRAVSASTKIPTGSVFKTKKNNYYREYKVSARDFTQMQTEKHICRCTHTYMYTYTRQTHIYIIFAYEHKYICEWNFFVYCPRYSELGCVPCKWVRRIYATLTPIYDLKHTYHTHAHTYTNTFSQAESNAAAH